MERLEHNMNIKPIRMSADPRPPALSELFASSRDGSAAGFMLAKIAAKRSGRPMLWVQDRMAAIETGSPSLRGLDGWGLSAGLIRVCVRGPADLIWAMEEGLGCKALSAVVGEIYGSPSVLDFTATKRLILRSERSGVPAYLLRVSAASNLSAAHERWRVTALPSAMNPYDRTAPGDPRWALDLFRARWRKPGFWEGRYDRSSNRLDMVPPMVDGALATHAPARRRAGA